MISFRHRLAVLTVILAGVMLIATYGITACPAHGDPATRPPLAPTAPACLDVSQPSPPWAR
ncbi:hypothetical protein [Micromonospora sp. NPDC004551]|uniref:hypothetical protein n=1 Tax=Micromonospora sp. NPDC004551 TaxID=3154284 RepID=UPI0033A6F73E